jgi:hypothetical protein
VADVLGERLFGVMDDVACPPIANDLAVPIAGTIHDALQAKPTAALPVKIVADLSFGEWATAPSAPGFKRQRAS